MYQRKTRRPAPSRHDDTKLYCDNPDKLGALVASPAPVRLAGLVNPDRIPEEHSKYISK